METHEERVIAERDMLEEKIEKLAWFLVGSPAFKAMSDMEQTLLRAQIAAMHAYSHILHMRVLGFAANASA